MKKLFAITLLLSLTLCACSGAGAVNTADSENSVQSQVDDLDQFATDYIGDASKVVGIVSGQDYPEGYSYGSVEMQTSTEPYELTVFLKKDEGAKDLTSELDENAQRAFELIGNMGILTYKDEAGTVIASYTKDNDGKIISSETK